MIQEVHRLDPRPEYGNSTLGDHLRQELADADVLIIPPRGAQRRSNGTWQNARPSLSPHQQHGGEGMLTGALRPIAWEILVRNDIIPPDVPIVVLSGQDPTQPSLHWGQIMRKSLEERAARIQQRENSILVGSMRILGHSNNTAGEVGIALADAAQQGHKKVLYMTDASQIQREALFRLLYLTAHPETNSLDGQTIRKFLSGLSQDPVWSLLADPDMHQAVQASIAENEGLKLLRLQFTHLVAQQPERFAREALETNGVQGVAKIFFDRLKEKTGKDWLNEVVPAGVIAKLRQNGTSFHPVPVERVLALRPPLARFTDRVKQTPDYWTTLYAEYGGIIQTLLGVYYAPEEEQRTVITHAIARYLQQE